MQWKNCATCADRITCSEHMGLVGTTCSDDDGTKGEFHGQTFTFRISHCDYKLTAQLNFRYVCLYW